MEFWGVEVKAGMPLKVRPQVDHLIRISQATVDGAKKGECGLLYVTVDWKKHVIGTLSQDHIPQISFDLVFEQEFELSHSLEQGSVHFVGYKSPNLDQEEDYPSDLDEEVEVPATSTVSNVVKADSKPKAEVKPESDEDDDDDESDEEEDDSEDYDESKKVMEVDEDDSEDDSEDEEEETPKQPEPSNKKRASASASKTPVPAKKAKSVVAATPQKTQNTGTAEKKKGGHTATPHPAKKGGNQSPKSGGQSFGGNKKQFNSGKQFGSNNKGKGKVKGKA